MDFLLNFFSHRVVIVFTTFSLFFHGSFIRRIIFSSRFLVCFQADERKLRESYKRSGVTKGTDGC